MKETHLIKEVRQWGNSGGISISKDLIGQKVYVLTEADIQAIKRLKEVF